MNHPNNRCLIFFADSAFRLEHAHRILVGAGLSVSAAPRSLRVQWFNGPVLTITLVRGSQVEAELARLPSRASVSPALGAATAFLRVTFEDLDAVLAEANTLIQTQLTLQAATNGHLFTAWNQRLSAPVP